MSDEEDWKSTELPTWEETKNLLDDPLLPDEQKVALLEAYYATDGGGNLLGGTHNDELEEYLDRHDVSWGDGALQKLKNTAGFTDSSDDRLKNAYKIAQETSNQKHQESGQAVLDGAAQRAQDGGAGVANSNELLDAGAIGLRYFETFLPLVAKAQLQTPTTLTGVYKRYDEQRDIDFHKIDIDIVELRKVAEDSLARQSDAEQSMGKVWANWTGAAADNSRAFLGRMGEKAKAHAEAVNTVADATRATCHTVSELVATKARQTVQIVGSLNDIYGRTPQEIDLIIQARDSGDEDLLERVAGFVGVDVGGCSDWEEEVQKACKQWLESYLEKDVKNKWEAFDALCTSTRDSVNQSWDALNGQIEAFNTKPFEPTAAEQPAEQPGQNGNGQRGNGQSGSGDTGSVPGGTSGSGTPGGSGTGSGTGTGGGVPSTPEFQMPGDTDGDGKVDDLDGDGKPDDPKGEEGAQDGGAGGGAGSPDGVKGGGPEPEKVTVRSGDNELTVTEPDDEGHVQLTVDSPNGQPKTYDLDFSGNPDAYKALTGKDLPTDGLPSGTSPDGAPAAPDAVGAGAVPAGGSAGASAGSTATPIQVGPDGRAVIEQDGLKIIAEVDPLTGEIALSVDDGQGGKPNEFGVEFGKDAAPEGGRVGGGLGPVTDSATGAASTARGFAADAERLVADRQGFTEPVAAAGQVTAEPLVTAQGFTEPVKAFTEPVQGFTEPVAAQQGFTEPAATPAHAAHGGSQGAPTPSAVGFDGAGGSTGGTTVTSGAQLVGDANSSFAKVDAALGGSSLSGSSPDGVTGHGSSDGSSDGGSFADTHTSQAGQAGSAVLPSMQDGQSGQAGGGMMGGGMMGGGMMGGGGQGGQGGGQGGDTERSSGQWRTTGSLFDDDSSSMNRLQDVLGEERR